MAAGAAERRPVATRIATLDSYVAAIVAGPVSISPARRAARRSSFGRRVHILKARTLACQSLNEV